jgi:hypothetical protein
MWEFTKKVLKYFGNFLQDKNGVSSSKRLVKVSSYYAAIYIAIFSVVHHQDITNNMLILLTALCGVSAGTYALTNKFESKKDMEGDDKDGK